MLHTFRCLNGLFAFDTESGLLIQTDELTFDLLRSKQDQNYGSLSKYSAELIAEGESEIQRLTEQGSLFCKERDFIMPEYSGVIKAMCLNVSHNCNLNCSYCFANGGTYNGKRENMPFDTACASIDFLIKRSGTRHNLEVDFFGGEPTLNLDVVEKTVEYAKEQEKKYNKNFRFTITTNALILDKRTIDFFNAVMDNVVISIDGRADVHNYVRKDAGGNPTFERVIKNALEFKRLRGEKQYFIRGTFTNQNKDFFKDIRCLHRLGFDKLSIEPAVLPDGHPLALKPEDIKELETQYDLLLEYMLSEEGAGLEFFHFMLDLDNAPCAHKRLKGCCAGSEYVAVAPDGSIYPCHQFDGNRDYLMGSVLTGEFDQNISRTLHDCCLLSKPDCAKCFAKYFCSGGCMANSYNFYSDIYKPYAPACALMKKRLECALALKALESDTIKR